MGYYSALEAFAVTQEGVEILEISVCVTGQPLEAGPPGLRAPANLYRVVTTLDRIDTNLGEFDYIIVPNLYSYLSDEAATYLLQTCEGMLSPEGLICIGHRTYPGAKAFESVRDAVLLHLHDQGAATSDIRNSQALAALAIFEEGIAPTNPMGVALRDAARDLRGSILRGHLDTILRGPTSAGTYFVEFAQHAMRAGLTCVGDARPQLDVVKHWGNAVRTTNSLLGLGQAEVVRQQYLDFASGRACRHTLLTRTARHTGGRSFPLLDRLGNLRWAGHWEPDDLVPMHAGQVYKDVCGLHWQVPDVLSARILDGLALSWPRTLSVGQLCKMTAGSEHDVLAALNLMFGADLLQYCVGEGPCDHLRDDHCYLAPEIAAPSARTATRDPESRAPEPLTLTDLWGAAVSLELSGFDRDLLFGKGNVPSGLADSILKFADSFANTDGATEVAEGNAVLSVSLLDKLSRFGLLAYSESSWRALVTKMVQTAHGEAGYWLPFVRTRVLESVLGDQLAEIPTITPQQQAQLDHLQGLLDQLAYTAVEPLARHAIERLPLRFEGWSALVNCLSGLGRYAEALDTLSRIAGDFKQLPEYYRLVAVTLSMAGKNDVAAHTGKIVIALGDNAVSGVLLNALGLACMHALHTTAAEQFFRRGIEVDPGFRPLAINLISALSRQGKVDDGITLCRDLLSRPDTLHDYRAAVYHNLLFFLNYHSGLAAEEILRDYRRFEKELCIPLYSKWRKHKNPRSSSRRLKIGYVSADFKDHAVSKFLLPVFEHHDKSSFEIFVYANMAVEDGKTTRYRSLADHWVNLYGVKDDEAAERIRDDGIDILVDLSGHTGGNRLGVFSRKPAPVSLTWLGYGYTTGVSAIDYFLGNEILCPEGSDHLFAEKPWRLPDTWMTYDPGWSTPPDAGPLPALSEGRITFVSLSRVIRINHRVIRVWAQILSQVGNSRLVINSGDFADADTCADFRARFEKFGIEGHRVMLGYTSPPWHSLQHSDIGLDCFPHNAGTTLLDMLALGVPYITMAERPSVGRIGSAPLCDIGHPEWIAKDEQDYVAKAVALASRKGELSMLRQSLPQAFQDSNILKPAAFTRKLEACYRSMFSSWSGRGS
jgi:predicted O-linked N-acetylglucosamine transferase (SPINDLY family)